MRNKLIKILSIAILVSAMGTYGLYAKSSDRREIERPGYTPPPVVKTVIFNVAKRPGHAPLFRASVECDYGRWSKRKRTDNTGTAPLSFSVKAGRHQPAKRVHCVVMKNGYRPTFKTFDVSRIESPQLVEVHLLPERSRR